MNYMVYILLLRHDPTFVGSIMAICNIERKSDSAIIISWNRFDALIDQISSPAKDGSDFVAGLSYNSPFMYYIHSLKIQTPVIIDS